MFQSDTSLKSYYAKRAREYDRVYDKPERQAALAQLRQWLPPIFAGSRAIEVACGTGYWTQFLAPVASSVMAVDTSPETLAVARARGPLPNVTFQVGDAYLLPTAEAPFSAAFCGFFLSHVPRSRQRGFLAGLGRVLCPGATVVFIDNLFVSGSSTPISRTDVHGNTYQARQLSDGSVHEVLKNFPSEAELFQLVSGIGNRVAYRTFEYYWAFTYAATAEA